MSTTTEQRSDTSVQLNDLVSEEPKQCLYCKSSFTKSIFAPYCSMSCSRKGIQKRYKLLRTFIDFESKYINPPEKPGKSSLVNKIDEEGGEEEGNKSKRLKKLPRIEYPQYVTFFREKSRKLLLEALQSPYETKLDLSKIDYHDIVCRIEQALYNSKPYSLNISYKGEYTSKLRELIFNLKDPSNPDLRNRLFSNELEPERLPLLSANDLASSELRKWREEKEQQHIAENVLLTSNSDRSFLSLTATNPNESKTTEEKLPPPPVVEVPKEPEPQVTIIQNDLTAEREKQMAAILESIPTVIETKEEPAETPAVPTEEPEHKEEEEKEEKPVEMMDLSFSKTQTTPLGITMPEGKPVFFNATVIDAPSDSECNSLHLEKVLSVIGRMSITTCEAYVAPRQDSTGYDVIWWVLELDKQTDENELQKFLKNFINDKRLGVLETGMKEKNLYFVPPSLDPVTASPIVTLSKVADGSYKQFCHLLYVRKRVVPRAKVLPSLAAKQPRTPPGSPPPSAYRHAQKSPLQPAAPSPLPPTPPGVPVPGAPVPGAPVPGVPLGPDGRPMFPPRMPLGPDGRPMLPPRVPLGPDGRPMYPPHGPPGPPPPGYFPRGPDGRPMFPRAPVPLGPDGRPMFPPRGPLGPDGRPMYPPYGGYPPRGPLGPDGRPLLPPRGPPGGYPPRFAPGGRPEPRMGTNHPRSRWDDHL